MSGPPRLYDDPPEYRRGTVDYDRNMVTKDPTKTIFDDTSVYFTLVEVSTEEIGSGGSFWDYQGRVVSLESELRRD